MRKLVLRRAQLIAAEPVSFEPLALAYAQPIELSVRAHANTYVALNQVWS